jgi:hypothetical protein
MRGIERYEWRTEHWPEEQEDEAAHDPRLRAKIQNFAAIPKIATLWRRHGAFWSRRSRARYR